MHSTFGSPNRANPTLLQLSETQVSDLSMPAVGRLTSIVELSLSNGTRIGDGGLPCLANLPDLYTLDLSRTGVTDNGVAALAGVRNLGEPVPIGMRVTDASRCGPV